MKEQSSFVKGLKWICLIGLLVICITSGIAQQVDYMVYLKNGSIIRGRLVEKTADQIKIETKDKNIWAFYSAEIEKLVEIDDIFDNTICPKAKGYANYTSIGILAGQTISDFSFTMVNGYEFKFGLFAGLGMGWETVQIAKLPLFIDLRYSIGKNKFSGYIYLQGGYSFPNDKSGTTYLNTRNMTYTGGNIWRGGIGIKDYLGDQFGIIASIGYSHQSAMESYSDKFWTSETEFIFSRVDVRFGFVFR